MRLYKIDEVESWQEESGRVAKNNIKLNYNEECKEGHTASPFDFKRRTRDRLSRKKESDPKNLQLQKERILQCIIDATTPKRRTAKNYKEETWKAI